MFARDGGNIRGIYVAKIAIPKHEIGMTFASVWNKEFPLKTITSLQENRRFGLILPVSLYYWAAKRCILEAELNNIKSENHQQHTWLATKRLDIIPSTSAEELVRETPQLYVPEAAADNIGLVPITPNQSFSRNVRQSQTTRSTAWECQKSFTREEKSPGQFTESSREARESTCKCDMSCVWPQPSKVQQKPLRRCELLLAKG